MLRCALLESGEVVLDGDPLLSMGETVVVGKWTIAWTPDHQLIVARISSTQQSQIHDNEIWETHHHPDSGWSSPATFR